MVNIIGPTLINSSCTLHVYHSHRNQGACDSECCKSARVKPNQLESHSILAATTHVALGQSKSVNSSWLTGSVCVRHNAFYYVSIASKPKKEAAYFFEKTGGCVYEDRIQQLEESA